MPTIATEENPLDNHLRIFDLGYDKGLYRVIVEGEEGDGKTLFTSKSHFNFVPQLGGETTPSIGSTSQGGGEAGGGTQIFTGELVGGQLHVPSKNGEANSFHVSQSGSAYWGAEFSDILSSEDNANAYILKTGVVKFISGTIAGFTLASSTMTATNFILDATNQKIVLGTGNDIFTADASDATYRLAIGHATYASAPFRVGKDGTFTATSATITGSITADSGNIANWFINTNTLSSGADESTSNVLIDSANNLIRLGPTSGDYITIDGENQRIRTSNYASGITGAGFNIEPSFAEFGDIRARGKFTTAVFESGTISSIAGFMLMTKGADVLDADMTALDASTMNIPTGIYAVVGDILRLKDGINDEWIEVTNTDSAPTYTVTRDKSGNYSANNNPTWKKGTAVVNYGGAISGDGGILMSSYLGPEINIFTHTGTPWVGSAVTEHVRLGDLGGFASLDEIPSNVYGIAIGDSSDYLYSYHDGTNVVFKLGLTSAGSNAKIDVGIDGYLQNGQTAYNTGTGWWLGNSGGAYKASIGDSSQFLTYASGVLSYKGAITAAYPITLKSYTTANLPDPIVDTGYNNPTATAS